MRKRYLTAAIDELALQAGKIAFVSGPRQCGKTTLSKMLLAQRGQGSACRNWDDVGFRRRWVKDPKELVPPASPASVPLLVLDEVHKDRRWKTRLKGLYDTLESPCRILVTGSARLPSTGRGATVSSVGTSGFACTRSPCASWVPPMPAPPTIFSPQYPIASGARPRRIRRTSMR